MVEIANTLDKKIEEEIVRICKSISKSDDCLEISNAAIQKRKEVVSIIHDKILKEIESARITKDKNKKCADAIHDFILTLSCSQKDKFWIIENLLSEYNSHIQDEILRLLL